MLDAEKYYETGAPLPIGEDRRNIDIYWSLCTHPKGCDCAEGFKALSVPVLVFKDGSILDDDYGVFAMEDDFDSLFEEAWLEDRNQ